jgi:hypothetical protein
VPVVPHSGGIGLNEYTQHLALINYISLGRERGLLEHINSFSEVITHPVKVQNGYLAIASNTSMMQYGSMSILEENSGTLLKDSQFGMG